VLATKIQRPPPDRSRQPYVHFQAACCQNTATPRCVEWIPFVVVGRCTSVFQRLAAENIATLTNLIPMLCPKKNQIMFRSLLFRLMSLTHWTMACLQIG
jgi:hypothetical protein